MKIMMIAAGSLSPADIKMRERYARAACAPDTVLEMVPAEGVVSVTDDTAPAWLGPSIMRRLQQAEDEHYDAAFVHCFSDDDLEAAKTLVSIPVVGVAQATYHLACLLADRFGLVIMEPEFIPGIRRLAQAYGMEPRIASIRTIKMPVLEARGNPSEVESRFLREAHAAIEEGAQLIIAATVILASLGPGSAKRLAESLGAIVLDPIAIAVKTAETLVALNLSQSKLAFPKARG